MTDAEALEADAARVPAQVGTPPPLEQIPVLIICHARPIYLSRAIGAVVKHRSNADKFPITASQDGSNQEVFELLQKRWKTGEIQRHLRFKGNLIKPPLQLNGKPPPVHLAGYFKLANHYRWALNQMFEAFGYEHLIILEEDLEVAPDFFTYFSATLPLLRSDPELFCVSAWNDNGKAEVAADERAIFRTDFFPGLGWMLLRGFWREIRDRWPPAYWDDFVRRKDVRKGRHCIRPEVSRTYTFGEQGVSKGQFFKTHLKAMVLNNKPVNWTARNLSFVSTASNFDAYLSKEVKAAELTNLDTARKYSGSARSLAVRYEDNDKRWKEIAKAFGLMEDAKEGIRRGAYRGVLAFTWQTRRIFLVKDWPLG